MGTSGSDSAATCPQTACFLPLPAGPVPPCTPQGVGHGAHVMGDEVIIPPDTFVSTGSAVLKVNALPIFVGAGQSESCSTAGICA